MEWRRPMPRQMAASDLPPLVLPHTTGVHAHDGTVAVPQPVVPRGPPKVVAAEEQHEQDLALAPADMDGPGGVVRELADGEQPSDTRGRTEHVSMVPLAAARAVEPPPSVPPPVVTLRTSPFQGRGGFGSVRPPSVAPVDPALCHTRHPLRVLAEQTAQDLRRGRPELLEENSSKTVVGACQVAVAWRRCGIILLCKVLCAPLRRRDVTALV